MGMVCTDGVVLGADSRAMLGNYFIAHRNVRKISKIDEHLGLTIAGGVADAQNIIDILLRVHQRYTGRAWPKKRRLR